MIANREFRLAGVIFVCLMAIPLADFGYLTFLIPQYLTFAMLAVSLGFLWGFVGILSFGQAGFFAIGAYTMGIISKADPAVNAAVLGIPAAFVVAGALAVVTGYFLFSANVRSTYFVLITIALSIIIEQIAVSVYTLTGGFDGLFINRIHWSLGQQGTPFSDNQLYFLILGFVVATFILFHRLLRSGYGLSLLGVRENEDRMVALGFKVHWLKTWAFGLAGGIAGLAGALYGTAAGFVAPSLAGVLFSTEVVVWVAVGGRKSLLGVMVGAGVVAGLSNYLSTIAPDYWQLVLGILFVAVIMFLSDGLAGLVTMVANRLKREKADGAA